MKPRYSSNSGMFAKRGDPWISRKEGIKDFGRNPDVEDAEYDFDHRFHTTEGLSFGKPLVAPKREEHFDPIPKKSTEPDYARLKANALVRMHQSLRGSQPRMVKVAPRAAAFRACAGCRKALCISRGHCQGNR